jgi:protein-S-isoprenylcysteine O-methyltransferase Ste14
MIAWLNFAVLIAATLLFLYYYVLSVSPEAMERLNGPGAYPKCARLRAVAIVFEFITVANYAIYYFYPLDAPLPARFPWPHWLSALIGALILLPSGALMAVGMIHAGEETARPRKEHAMYGGVYEKMRHPQAAGEVFLWWAIAFFLHSPTLVLYSFVFVPVFLLMCWAEEHDLVLRFGDDYIDYHRRTGAFWPKR